MKKIGQITVKKIGKKYAACIAGTPHKIKDTYDEAEEEVEKLRTKYGRRHYKHKKGKRKKNG